MKKKPTLNQTYGIYFVHFSDGGYAGAQLGMFRTEDYWSTVAAEVVQVVFSR